MQVKHCKLSMGKFQMVIEWHFNVYLGTVAGAGTITLKNKTLLTSECIAKLCALFI